MDIKDLAFFTVDWNEVEVTEQPGEEGIAYWKTIERGNVRVRMVEMAPGFRAERWCLRGHVALVIEGEILMELEDGRSFRVSSGMSFQVAENAEPHSSHSLKGAKLFIVD